MADVHSSGAAFLSPSTWGVCWNCHEGFHKLFKGYWQNLQCRLEQTGSTPETLFLTFYYYSKIQEIIWSGPIKVLLMSVFKIHD